MFNKQVFMNLFPVAASGVKKEHYVRNDRHFGLPRIGKAFKPVLGKLVLVLVVLVVGGLTAFGCAARGTQPQGWSGVVVSDSALFYGAMDGKIIALNKDNGSGLWEVALETPKSSGGFGCAPSSNAAAVYGTPVVAGDLVYVGAYVYVGNQAYGKIYAYNVTTGALRWVYPRQDNLDGAVIGGLAVVGASVYFGTADGTVYALNAATGDWRWDARIDGEIWSTPVIDGDSLYVGTLDKKLYALDITNGSKKWAPVEVGGAIATPLVIHDNIVYFGSFDRHLYAVEATSGTLKWKSEVEAGNWFWARPVIVNNLVYAASLDGKVYALDAESGLTVAEFDLGSSISSSPVLVDNTILVATEEGVLYSLDTKNNREKRLADVQDLTEKELGIYSPLAVSDGVIFVHAQTKKYGSYLYALDAVTGARVWRSPPPGSK